MTIQYTPLADRLLAYLAADRLNLSAKSSSLNTSILLSSDLFNQEGGIVTANYGFDGYMGIPGMDGTDAESQQIAFDNNVAWNNLGDLSTTTQRAYTSAISTDTVQSVYGVNLEKNDNIPIDWHSARRFDFVPAVLLRSPWLGIWVILALGDQKT